MIKRKDIIGDEALTWLDNAIQEDARHPFRAILARNNNADRPESIDESALADSLCAVWDNPHGCTVNTTAHDMAKAVTEMLVCCRWVNFIDPHISTGRPDYRPSLPAFLNILGCDQPVGPRESIEIHTGLHHGTAGFFRDSFLQLIPNGLRVTFYQSQERLGGRKPHNRYVPTDIGGVSFQHGLDIGADGETDGITRLDLAQYIFRFKEYDSAAAVFDQATVLLVMVETLGGWEWMETWPPAYSPTRK